MLISKKHHFIFIHIYKNAGTSITNALRPFAASEWEWALIQPLKKLKIQTYSGPHPFHDHIQASEVIDALGSEAFNNLFSFAIVRNPWDWQVSLYNFALKNINHYQHDLVKNFENFDEYIKWRCTSEIKFQKDFIYSHEGELLVNFVGRFENLDTDFKKICSHIGITASLPKLNVSNTKLYQQFYTDETRELVRHTFHPDIELLGYDF